MSQPQAPHFTAAGTTFHSRARRISQSQAPRISQPQAPHFTAACAACHDILSAHQKPLTMYLHASTMQCSPGAA
eukprot:4622878-Pyramimonas_sp.AAC.2